MIHRAASAAVLALLSAGCAAPFAGEPSYRPPALTRAGAPSQPRVARPDDREEPGGGLHPEAPPLASDAEPEMSLADCLRVALENHRTVRIADRRVLIARDRYAEAKAMLMPEIKLSGRFETRTNDRGAIFGGGEGIVTGERDVGSARLSVLVPIYDFGLSAATRTARSGDIEAAELGARRVRQDLEFAVRQAYFRVLEARRIREVVDESLGVVDEQLRVARDFLEQGLVSGSDVLTAEVQRAERLQERIRADGNVELAVATLNRVMGVDVTRPTAVADVLDVEPWTGTFTEALAAAIETRPDLLALRKQVEIARADWQLARVGMTPRFYAFGEFDHVTDDFLLHKTWMAGGVALELPLFDGGATRARLLRSRKEIAQTIDLHDERVDDVVLDLKAAFLAAGDAAGRLPVARDGVRLAEENLRIVRNLYAEGLATTADVLREEDRLSRARSGHLQALYDAHEAHARLLHVIGRDPVESP